MLDKIRIVHYYSGLLMMFSLPFNLHITLFLLIFWFLSGFAFFDNTRMTFSWKGHILPLSLIVFFAIHVVSSMLSINKLLAFKELLVLFPLVVFPIGYFLGYNQSHNQSVNYIKAFVLGIIASSIICILLAFYRSFSLIDGHIRFNPFVGYRTQFVYTYLSVFMYTTYFAMFIVFSIAVIIWSLIYKKGKFKRQWLFAGIVLGITMIFLLSARTDVYAMFLILYFSILIFYLKYRKLLYSIGFIILITCLFWFFQTYNSRVVSFSKQVTEKVIESSKPRILSDGRVVKGKMEIQEVNIRLKMWQSGWKVIREHWLLGVGFGDFNDKLTDRYQQDGLKEAFEKRFNQHNQYLETWGRAGLFALLILIGILVYGFISAIFHRNFLLMVSIIIISTNFIMESMLDRLAGVIFLSFCLSFLPGIQKQEKW
jgi:O-antigen ligase